MYKYKRTKKVRKGNYAEIKVIEALRQDPQQYRKALALIKNYVQKYPEDNQGLYYYAQLARLSGDYLGSLEILERVHNDAFYALYVERIKCYLEMEKYEEIINFYENERPLNLPGKMEAYLRKTWIFSLKKLGYEIDPSKVQQNYLENQIYCYHRESALDYTRRLFQDEGILLEEEDVQKMFYDIESVLDISEKFMKSAKLTDSYYYRYVMKVGDLEKTLLMKASTVRDTQDIIAIYPMMNKKNVASLPINDFCLLTSPLKDEKQPSKIDQFYKKYPNLKQSLF